ncbi:MAG TPA: glycine oxidase ThiO [Planctomycetaceae bacterium]|nr:glycine oxidase ThiO [Planctomycetaceae bacterium]
MSDAGAGVVLLGGGVVGLTTALLLRQRGMAVTLVERARAGTEASWAGAGMLPPGRAVQSESAEARLRSFSFECWPKLNELLRRLTGEDNGYRVCGSVLLADTSGEAAAEAMRWQRDGVAAEALEGADLRRRIPQLKANWSAATWLPEFAQVRNPWHLRVLQNACLKAGVMILEQAGEAVLEQHSGRIIAVRLSDRTLVPTAVCLTSGAWTGPILAQFGIPIPIRPIRGQMVLLQTQPGWLPHVIESGRRYLVPREDGLILVGSTEEDAGFCRSTTVSGVRGLLEFACDLSPELQSAPVVKTWAGLRPGTPDGLPFLGLVTGFENLFAGAGHFRSGLQMSAGTAEILCELILTGRSPLNLSGLTFDRFVIADMRGPSCER